MVAFGTLTFPSLLQWFLKRLSHVLSYSYLEHYKAIFHNQQGLHDVMGARGICWEENRMSVINSNIKVIIIKNKKATTLHGKAVQVTEPQKDLGIIANNCLTWLDSSKNRCYEGMNILFQLKRNLIEKAHWTTKLIASTVYVAPIVTYASQDWMPNRTIVGITWNIQGKATNWSCEWM